MLTPYIELPVKYTEWQRFAIKLGFVDFVSSEDEFTTLLSSGEKWLNRDACGVYFWIAADGETYVGQTVGARSRLRAHWRSHPDLAYASFQVVPSQQLDAVEQAMIRQVCSAGYPTRNIKHAIQTERYVPFDRFVSKTERDDFLEGVSLPNKQWRDMPVLQVKQKQKYLRLQRLA